MTDAMSKVGNNSKTKHRITVISVIISHVTKFKNSGHRSIVHYIRCCTNRDLSASPYLKKFHLLQMHSSLFSSV